ncbi:MAG: DNA-directed RNA polymerase subunit alpha [Candidatus Nomurabacteria bacterium]|jgi:DNA-directed RNA polymerase subunit alpha|nr:DNA-directed RNA polymerase subunit alpha [Candidatus Nomurabacteria bacterium]
MSQAIHNPSLTKVDSASPTSATFTVEPLYQGYGQTLGNSLRRVLLSSIEGAAITAFNVEGAAHEFTTLPGVKEDVVEIMLNLKNIRFRSFSDQPVELSLSQKGGGVTAAAIKTTADIEVVNPDALIATIDDPKTTLKMNLVVEKGRGYQTIEKSTVNRLHSDMIALDAVFSPVQRVRYHIENARVGQVTDLDRLILTIDTDGSISPKDAFEQAAAILVSQYQALAGTTKVEAIAAPGVKPDSGESMLELPVEELNLSARTANALINNDIHTINDLVTMSEEELRDLKGFGSKAFDEVRQRIAELEF